MPPPRLLSCLHFVRHLLPTYLYLSSSRTHARAHSHLFLSPFTHNAPQRCRALQLAVPFPFYSAAATPPTLDVIPHAD